MLGIEHRLPTEFAVDLYRRMYTKANAAKQRCHNPEHPAFKNYGARGIKLYLLWQANVKAFALYLMDLPGSDNVELVLDRIDNNRGYEPGNLRFVTQNESAANRRPKSDEQGPPTPPSLDFRGAGDPALRSTRGRKPSYSPTSQEVVTQVLETYLSGECTDPEIIATDLGLKTSLVKNIRARHGHKP